jgi:hypothetical protein
VKRLGIVINGVELIPAEVFERHIPFAVPPGQTAVTAWAFEEPDGALTAADQEFLLDQNQWYHAEQQRLMAELDDLRNEMNADRESTRRSIVRRLNAESERDALKREINLLRSTWAPPEDDSVGMF